MQKLNDMKVCFLMGLIQKINNNFIASTYNK